jgi:hypothetical protein
MQVESKNLNRINQAGSAILLPIGIGSSNERDTKPILPYRASVKKAISYQ